MAALRSTEGFAGVKKAITTPATAVHGDHGYATVLTGFDQNTAIHGFRTPDGKWTHLPDHGVLAGSALLRQLDGRVGDQITLSTQDGRATEARPAGAVDEPLGTPSFMPAGRGLRRP